MEIEFHHCGALHFPSEQTARDLDQFTSCCHKGAVVLLPLLPFPEELKLLFLRKHPLSQTFYQNIRNYNSAVAFVSVVSNIQSIPGRGPYMYKISGQIYHFLGPAQPNTGDIPTFGQLYFLNTADAHEHRSNNPINIRLNPILLLLLDSLLRQINPYAQAFKMMREVCQEENDTAVQQNQSLMEVQIIFDNNYHLDQCRYNIPQVNEVAAVFVGPGSENFPSHCLAVHPHSNQLTTIPVTNKNCDPMSYPLLFPKGDIGWHPYISNCKQNQTKRTKCIYIAILLL
ncbi:hypothetical protein C2G38_1964869 [Gigaspora rosea]|uniref:Helitron helicase-like domain-containing protein n=1 Tax=Gigaspora rosea TaxID=44941 RepID=A0A397VB44_9GLOM|nr:hypothetical protein C2G38_1964869 [Gigaspora rosea]